MEKIKWYHGMKSEEVVSHMSALAHDVVAYAKRGEHDTSENLFVAFGKKFEEVIPAVVEQKTYYYGLNQQVFGMWEKVQSDLWIVKRGMEKDLYNVYVNTQ